MDSTLRIVSETAVATDLIAIFTNEEKFGYCIRIEGVGLVRHTECLFDSEESVSTAAVEDYTKLDSPEALQAALNTLTVMDDGYKSPFRQTSF